MKYVIKSIETIYDYYVVIDLIISLNSLNFHHFKSFKVSFCAKFDQKDQTNHTATSTAFDSSVAVSLS